MSLNKKIFGILLIIFTFSLVFLLNLPSIFMNNSKIERNVDIELEFLKDNKSKIVFLYFGYVGCDTICTPALEDISKIYKELNSTNLNFYFVNLLTNIEPEIIKPYVKAFHKEFNGVYLSKDELNKIENNFRLNLISLDEYSLNHSGFLYLLLKKDSGYILKYIYITKPFDKIQILSDVNKLLLKD